MTDPSPNPPNPNPNPNPDPDSAPPTPRKARGLCSLMTCVHVSHLAVPVTYCAFLAHQPAGNRVPRCPQRSLTPPPPPQTLHPSMSVVWDCRRHSRTNYLSKMSGESSGAAAAGLPLAWPRSSVVARGRDRSPAWSGPRSPGGGPARRASGCEETVRSRGLRVRRVSGRRPEPAAVPASVRLRTCLCHILLCHVTVSVSYSPVSCHCVPCCE